jgi:signal transduction histidine kinase
VTLSIRVLLIAVALLSTVACGGALYAIAKLAENSAGQRTERAREAVGRELDQLRDASEHGAPQIPLRGRGRLRRVQSGLLNAALVEVQGALLPPVVRDPLADAARVAGIDGEPVLRERPLPQGTLVVGVVRLRDGSLAWAAARAVVPQGEELWRFGVGVLALASIALVVASLSAMVLLSRGAASLRGSLALLAHDLGAPVARPAVRELRHIADGIASLAQGLRRAQDEQARLGRELTERERLAALGRVAAGVAHEVRNPLAAIKLRVDLARRGAGVAPQLSQDLGEISSEVERLNRLVTDLMAVAGRKSGPKVRTDLGEMTRRRVALLSPWADERGVPVEVTGGAEAMVDADAVARAFDNLVRNAVEASPPGRGVDVEVRQTDRSAEIVVTDHGPGVPPQRIAELFEPFFTTKPDGTGLGLALSRSIAAAHDGALSYERAGAATRFVLSLARTPTSPSKS